MASASNLIVDLRRTLTYLALSQYYGWKSFLMYRLQAIIAIISSVLGLAFSIFIVAIIYLASSGIPGWTYYQLTFLVLLATFTFNMVSYVNMYSLPEKLRNGRFDLFLVKPVGYTSLFLSPPLASFFPISLLTDLIFLLYFATKIDMTLRGALMFIPAYILGAIGVLFFFVAVSILSYYLIKSGNFLSNFIGTLRQFSRYPLSVYGFIPQMIFSLLIPIGIAAYYPVQILLGRVDLPTYIGLLALEIVIILVAHTLIYRLMKGYTGGGG